MPRPRPGRPGISAQLDEPVQGFGGLAESGSGAGGQAAACSAGVVTVGGCAVLVLDDRRHRPRSGRPGRHRGHRAAAAGSARRAGWLTVMRRPRITSHSASRNSPMNVTVETWVQEPPETNWPMLS